MTMSADAIEQWMAYLVEAIVDEDREKGLSPEVIKFDVNRRIEHAIASGILAPFSKLQPIVDNDWILTVTNDQTNYFLGEESYWGDALSAPSPSL